jgi:hypothetical protein
MARPQKAFTAKPAKKRNTRPDKLRMSNIRMRRDIERIKVEQAKAVAETPTRGRK